jgi:3-methyladenine DNA glycosylase AlkD
MAMPERQRWMVSDHAMAARAGWSMTAERVAKKPTGLDLVALLDRIEAEMATAEAEPQWTMNTTLAMIGIHHPMHRARALAIGERLRDLPRPPDPARQHLAVRAELDRRDGPAGRRLTRTSRDPC